ncbi:hypothetical protein RRU94_09600 [Domibacillus sp. DTU_2020_1001157_1_SI_ALB_TIR_016]|nr:hypothetical protein [Domibacillus sp. DTU_2020_1001157_1_SI_ALB_TIR_016]WNS81063.1 hypothetical protein RRU94_09600 [Domibacillus sp. DTU_2020_1001157_1_SI_ALB_TIR_016]
MKTPAFPGTQLDGKRSDLFAVMSIHSQQVTPKAGVCQQPEAAW